jgi:hypothetical protein
MGRLSLSADDCESNDCEDDVKEVMSRMNDADDEEDDDY